MSPCEEGRGRTGHGVAERTENRSVEPAFVVCREDITQGLRALGVAPGDVVWAHSSLRSFGHVVGGPDAVVDGLLDAVGPTGSLALPTFTWGLFHDRPIVCFDVAMTPCETGCIPEAFRQRPGVQRSHHVCHSVAASGPHADRLMGDGIRSFWGNTVFDALYDLDGWNIMLGVGFQACTALHAAEEIVQVPYRAYRDFSGSTVRLPDGTALPSDSLEYLRQDQSCNDFAKMEGLLIEQGHLQAYRIGAARVTAVRMRCLIDVAVACLRADPLFLSGQPTPETSA